jgi:hypothetical protein
MMLILFITMATTVAVIMQPVINHPITIDLHVFVLLLLFFIGENLSLALFLFFLFFLIPHSYLYIHSLSHPIYSLTTHLLDQ